MKRFKKKIPVCLLAMLVVLTLTVPVLAASSADAAPAAAAAETVQTQQDTTTGSKALAAGLAIGLAAAVGGFTYDNLGINGIFLAAAGISVMAALLIAVSFSLFARDTGHKA